MSYDAKDLERWTAFLEDKRHGQEVPASVGAQLIADVRREALEEAAEVADAAREKWLEAAPPRAYEVAWSATVALDLAERIRALKDGGEPVHPNAPKCKVCGGTRPRASGYCQPSDPEFDHRFEPDTDGAP